MESVFQSDVKTQGWKSCNFCQGFGDWAGLLLGVRGGLVFSWDFGFALSVVRVVTGMDSVTGVLLKGPQTSTGVYSCGDRVNSWGKSQVHCLGQCFFTLSMETVGTVSVPTYYFTTGLSTKNFHCVTKLSLTAVSDHRLMDGNTEAGFLLPPLLKLFLCICKAKDLCFPQDNVHKLLFFELK